VKKLNAGILIIGDEVLSGRTQDTNSNFIAKKLIESGIQLDEIKVIHDQMDIIIEDVLKFHNKYTYVFTTGGIGPTHDDITSESIARAFNQKYCFHEEAYKVLENFYPKGEFNEGRKKMAKMPEHAKLIFNPLTAAPGFILENIYVLPGVPSIMQRMFLNLLEIIEKGSPKKTITIHTNLFESSIALDLGKIQDNFRECSIGSYPYFNYVSKKGGVNIVVSSWTLDSLDEVVKKIQEMISLLGGKNSIV
jgi:molybdenum cofactor synthesis domain-containing protein